jgi:hypothetical protein
MNDKSFIDKVKKHFAYLEVEYHFRLTHASNSTVRPEIDGVVEYTSATTSILIDSETGYVMVRFYRTKDGKNYYLTPIDVYEYLNTSGTEKELLLSKNPADETAINALFSKTFLLNQPGWKGSRGTADDVDKELRSFSEWLRTHAYLFLKEDFSLWPKLFEYKIYRARAEKLRRGEDDLVYTMITDEDGKRKLVKQSAFRDDLEYVERLKKELSL